MDGIEPRAPVWRPFFCAELAAIRAGRRTRRAQGAGYASDRPASGGADIYRYIPASGGADISAGRPASGGADRRPGVAYLDVFLTIQTDKYVAAARPIL